MTPRSSTQSPLRVCFLDVDGVICCNQTGVLEPSKLTLLQKVVRKTGVKIVLSTNWRHYADLKRRLIRTLATFGIECIGDTPSCGHDSQLVRPLEIASWIKAWNLNDVRPKMEQYVAIDDRLLTSEEGGSELEGHFVHTNPSLGITEHEVRKMIEIFLPSAPSSPGSPVSLITRELDLSPWAAELSPPFGSGRTKKEPLSVASHRKSSAVGVLVDRSNQPVPTRAPLLRASTLSASPPPSTLADGWRGSPHSYYKEGVRSPITFSPPVSRSNPRANRLPSTRCVSAGFPRKLDSLHPIRAT
ncbi:hypothetical protein AB1Y20_023477 [Prymnesium parvum]